MGRHELAASAIAIMLGGCYLSHEPPSDAPIASDAPCPALPIPAPSCAPRSLPATFAPRFDDGAPPQVLALAADGCDDVYAIRTHGWARSSSAGESFAVIEAGPAPAAPVVIAPDPLGGAHAIYVEEGVVMHRTWRGDVLDPPERLGGGGAARLFTGPTEQPWHVAAVGPDGTLAVVWSEPRWRTFHLALRDPSGAVRVRELVTGPEDVELREARLCYAGDHLVVAWERVPDAGGAEVWGAIDDGAPVRLGQSSALTHVVGDLDVACRADGCALVAWAERESPGAVGVARVVAASFVDVPSIPAPLESGPVYPRLYAGASRALLHLGGSRPGAYALLDWQGRTPAVHVLDERFGGVARVHGACAHPSRDDYFVVADSSRLLLQRLALRLDAAGNEIGYTSLAVPAAPTGARITCGARGVLLDAAAGELTGWAPP